MALTPVRRQVALLVETSNAYARGLLGGVRAYVRTRPGWSLYLAEHSRHETDFSWLDGWQGHGLIARIETAETAALVRRLGLPTVDLSAARLVPELPGVETDDDAIARLAVEHFAERGLHEFAFCGDERFEWSRTRGERFTHHVAARGGRARTFAMQRSGMRSRDRQRLARWLEELPKPVGVLACYDIAGQEILEACTAAGIPVPDAVAVLGVDNDELIGTLTSPPLSSIEPDTTRTGHLAAEMLDRMLQGEVLEPGLRLIPPLRVVARQSSEILSVDDPQVAEALRFVRDHAHADVGVAQVLRHVGSSRRALDMRFVRLLGRTVHAEITRVRIERVAELLSTTDLTLPQIAERLDFASSEYMSMAFKRSKGKAPGRYRRDVRGTIRPGDA
ncbi:helix-turn-helix domain-containing protein [Auraticoccus sp. F435]|uniref:Helix-turn-helix domain-containing protein n=1 Tax=Auraticoccus cholistanensis TaxID=2656650 RepID=A0A6A9UTI1_9ACTN|nr:xylose operon transcription regulator XylR [Auraticoccus cholistanensis]MVA74972.1 helix-turn-helix domain-containing protein [Auraticoccus cholistanensis]